MEPAKLAWGLMIGLPSIIITVALVVFPEWAAVLLTSLVVLWFAAIVAWLILRNRQLESELDSLKATRVSQKEHTEPTLPPPTPTASSWKLLDEIDLLLDRGWQATRTFHLKHGDAIRVTAAGKNRFLLHLVTNLTSKRFTTRESSAPTTSIQRPFDIANDDEYAIVVQPVGDAPFHVKVRVEMGVGPGSLIRGSKR